MARAITRDPREYRRGMVLGLTLAETLLLLLLFLLLMAAAAMLWRANDDVRRLQESERVAVSRAVAAEGHERVAEEALVELRPVLEALQLQGTDAPTLVALAARLELARDIESDRDRLRDALALAQAALARAERSRLDAESQVAQLRATQGGESALRDMLARAAPLDPGRPPVQVLGELVELLGRQPEAGQAGAVDALATRVEGARASASAATAAQQALQMREGQVAASQEEVERLRRLLAGRGGAGELYPSCWASGGRAEYAFEVTLRNGGEVVVRDTAGGARQASEAWSRLAPFPRGVPIPVATFVSAVQGLAEWSTQQRPECRFFVQVRRELRAGTPFEEYNRVLGPLGNPSSRHLPFYRVGG